LLIFPAQHLLQTSAHSGHICDVHLVYQQIVDYAQPSMDTSAKKGA
jgi:hypothetical protein